MAFKKDVVLEKKHFVSCGPFFEFLWGTVNSVLGDWLLRKKKKHENKKTSVVPNDVLPDFGPISLLIKGSNIYLQEARERNVGT